MIIIKLIISPKERQKFSFLTCFSIEVDISNHFHKTRLKCEIFSLTFTREKGPISCQSREKFVIRPFVFVLIFHFNNLPIIRIIMLVFGLFHILNFLIFTKFHFEL